eukprot:TRINITY_DN9935_c0_g1_i2.p2 TRINITY_DN9935_c0_g1~~TRINITY_DN9935_c0_g1_i2.p2  ORF type:complete len:105 (-),score=8.93 TRINITY_DN9935_c0_g1_i2:207-521(-)
MCIRDRSLNDLDDQQHFNFIIMKKLNELKGVKMLTKNEQKTITGGLACEESADCLVIGHNYCCTNRVCRRSIYPCMYQPWLYRDLFEEQIKQTLAAFSSNQMHG